MQWSPVQAKGTMLNANMGTSKLGLETYIFYFHLFSFIFWISMLFFPSQVVHVERRDVRHSGPAKSAPARRLEIAGFNMFQHPPRVYGGSNWHSMRSGKERSGIHFSFILIVWAFSLSENSSNSTVLLPSM